MKRLWRSSYCISFLLAMESFVVTGRLKEKLSKIFKLHFFVLIMKSFVVACSLRRGFLKPPKFVHFFCAMLFVGYMCVKKGEAFKDPQFYLFIYLVDCEFCEYMKLTGRAFKNLQICIFFVLRFLWLYMLKRKDFQDLWVAFLCYYGI